MQSKIQKHTVENSSTFITRTLLDDSLPAAALSETRLHEEGSVVEIGDTHSFGKDTPWEDNISVALVLQSRTASYTNPSAQQGYFLVGHCW